MTWLLTSNILFDTIFKRENRLSLLSFKREVIPHISPAVFKASFKKFSFWL